MRLQGPRARYACGCGSLLGGRNVSVWGGAFSAPSGFRSTLAGSRGGARCGDAPGRPALTAACPRGAHAHTRVPLSPHLSHSQSMRLPDRRLLRADVSRIVRKALTLTSGLAPRPAANKDGHLSAQRGLRPCRRTDVRSDAVRCQRRQRRRRRQWVARAGHRPSAAGARQREETCAYAGAALCWRKKARQQLAGDALVLGRRADRERVA